jgi:hypothetical protein
VPQEESTPTSATAFVENPTDTPTVELANRRTPTTLVPTHYGYPACSYLHADRNGYPGNADRTHPRYLPPTETPAPTSHPDYLQTNHRGP